MIRSLSIAIASALALSACAPQDSADVRTETAAPEAIAPSSSVVDVAIASPDHTTLVTAVQAAALVETLSGTGPFTVFAPTNAAFAKLPPGTVESLTQPESRDALTRILTYHVVAGRVSAADLGAQIDAGAGRATLTTVQGATLVASRAGSAIQLTDGAGAVSLVSTTDLSAANGVVHVIDTVLTPPAS